MNFFSAAIFKSLLLKTAANVYLFIYLLTIFNQGNLLNKQRWFSVGPWDIKYKNHDINIKQIIAQHIKDTKYIQEYRR